MIETTNRLASMFCAIVLQNFFFKGTRKLSTLLLLAVFGLSIVQVKAQSTANYTFSTVATGSLSADMNANAVDLSSGATAIHGVSVDDASGTLTNLNLGSGAVFEFWFMGNRYTQFSAGSNGMIQLGSAISTTAYNLPQTTNPVISPFSADLKTGTNGAVRAKVVGTAPNRCLVVEYFNMMLHYGATNAAGTGTYQARFYESTGIIEFVYGAMARNANTPGTSTVTIGFSSNTTTNNVTSVNTTTHASNTTAPVTTNTYAISSAIGSLNSASDGSRRFYRFTPPTPAAPSALTFTAIGPLGMTVNWTASSPTTNVLKYAVYYSSDGGATYTFANSTNVGTNTLAVTGLTPGTTYDWRVLAVSEGALSTTAATGTQATSPPATYYWVGTATATFGTAATWNTAADGTGTTRTSPQTTDVLIIDGAGTTAGAAVTGGVIAANAGIGQLKITSNTTVTLLSSVGPWTITINGGGGDDFVIENGSTLSLTNSTAGTAVNFVFAGTGNTGDISGTLTFGAGTTSTFTTTGGTGTLVTVKSTGIVNMGAATIRLVGSAATLSFANGSNCNASGSTTQAPPVPLATWGTTSNLTITNITTSTNTPTNSAQSFGNLIYNCPAATATITFFGTSIATVKGDLTIAALGAGGKFRCINGSPGFLTINGNVNVNNTGSGTGALEFVNGTGTVSIIGNVNVNNASIVNFAVNTGGTINVGGNVTVSNTAVVNFGNAAGASNTTNITGNLNLNSSGTSTFALGGGLQNVNLTGNFSQTNGSLQLGTSTGGAVLLKVAGLFSAVSITNPGTVAGGSTIEFNGTTSQSVSPGSTFTGLTNITVSNPAGIAVTGTLPVNNNAGNTAGATFTAAANGTAVTSGTVSYGNLGTLDYTTALGAQTTGSEFPASFLGSVVKINNSSGVTLNSARSIGASSRLNLASGILSTSSTNTLTILNTATTAVFRTASATSNFVSGPLTWTFPAIASTTNYIFPLGKTATYLPLTLSPSNVTATATAAAEAFLATPDAADGSTLSSLSSTEYWTVSTTGTYTQGNISLGRQSAVTAGSVIGRSTTGATGGSYAALGGTVSGNNINTSSSTGDPTGAYAMATPNTNFYYGESLTTNVNDVNAWWSAKDGTGLGTSGGHPSAVTAAGIVLNIQNSTTAPTMSASIVLGSGAKFVIGGGSSAASFTIPSGFSLTGGAVDVTSNGTLVIQNTTIPTFGTLNAASTVNYNSANTVNQTVTGGVTYGNLILSNSTGSGTSTKSLAANITGIAGDLTVNDFTTFNLATFTANRTAAGGTLSVSANGILRLSGLTAASNYPLNFTTNTLSGTVDYYAAGGQTISRTSAATVLTLTYNNLTLSGSGAKTLASTSTVNGVLSMQGTATTAGTVVTYGSAATLEYKGSSGQNTGIEFPGSFTGTGGVIINNGSTVTLNSARSIGASSLLTLSSGILVTTGTNILTILNTANNAISRTASASTNFVSGPLIWTLPTISSTTDYIYPLGKTATYLPFTLSPSSVTSPATVTAEAFLAAPSSADGTTLISLSSTEYWVASASANYSQGTVSLGRQTSAAGFVIGRSATGPTGGSYADLGGTPSGNDINTSNATGAALGYFAFGARPVFWVGGASGDENNWNNGLNWSAGSVPTSSSSVLISDGTYFCNIPSGAFAANNLVLSGNGDLRLASGAALTISGSFSSGSSVAPTFDCGSTLNMTSASAQNVPAFSYGNLNLTGGNRTFANGATTSICGTLTPGAGVITLTGSAINFNGTGNQTIPALAYTNLTISNARSGIITLAGGTISVSGTLDISTLSGNTWANAGNTFLYNGVGNQTVGIINYNNLTIGGARVGTPTLAFPAGSIGIAGAFSWTFTGSLLYAINPNNIINYNGTGAQTIITLQYQNLTISGTRSGTPVITLASSGINSGIIDIARTFAVTATGAYMVNVGTSTVNFNSTTFNQPLPAFFYNEITNFQAGSITINAGGPRTWASSGIIDINAGFDPSSGVNTITGSTIRYSSSLSGWTLIDINTNVGSGIDYNNLIFSGSGTWELGSGVNIGTVGDVTLSGSGDLFICNNTTPNTLTVGGNYSQTNSISTMTVSFNNGNGTLNVTGNLSLTGGTINNVFDDGNGTITVGGDFTQNGGNVTNADGYDGTVGTIAVTGTYNLLSNHSFINVDNTGFFNYTTRGVFTAGAYNQTNGQTYVSYSYITGNVSTMSVTGATSVSGGIFYVGANVGTGTFTTGSLALSGAADFHLIYDNSSPSTTVTVNGTLSTAGTSRIYLNYGGSSSTFGTIICNDFTTTSTSTRIVDFNGNNANNQIQVKGNFNKSGTGNFYTIGISPAKGFVFNKGSGVQTFSYSGTGSDYTNYVIESGSTVQMLTGLVVSPGDLGSPASTFTVNGTLDCVDKTISSGGSTNTTFTLASGGTLKSSNVNGIWNGTIGSVSNSFGPTRGVFNSGANYEFYGTANITSNFKNTTMNNLKVNLTGTPGTTGVPGFNNLTINSIATVSNNLDMTSGNIYNTGANYIAIGTSTTNVGTLSYTSGYVVGTMRRYFANSTNSGNATGLFPIGQEDTSYVKNRFFKLEYTAAPTPTPGYLDVKFNPANMGTLGLSAIPQINGLCPFNVTSTEDQGHWIATPGSGQLGNGLYTISLTGEGFSIITDLCPLTLLKRVGGGAWTAPGTHIEPSGSPSVPTVSRSGVTGFSNFGFGGGAPNPLPVELVNFTGWNAGADNQLQWKTASELNSLKFIVEKQTDGGSFAYLGELPAAGNSNQLRTYNFTDVNPVIGNNYYRLKIIDTDGSYEYSNVINIPVGQAVSDGFNRIYPNPTGGNLNIEVQSSSVYNTKVSVFNILGANMFEVNKSLVKGMNLLQFDFSSLAKGSYILQFGDNKGKIHVAKFVKE